MAMSSITPEERRKVAAKLREYPIALLIALQKTVKSKALAELGELMRIAGVDQGNPEELFIRLADLIDPTCHQVIEDETQACSVCSGDLDEGYGWDFCPWCGSRMVSGDE